MRLTFQCCWLKGRTPFCNGFLSGVIPLVSKCTAIKGNVPSFTEISNRQIYQSTYRLSYKNKQLCSDVQYNKFKVQSLGEVDENRKESNHNLDKKYELKGIKAHSVRQEELLCNKLREEAQRVDQISNLQWDAIRISILEIPGLITEQNIDAIIMNNCAELSLSLCKSYFKYLKCNNKRINRATYGNYLLSFHRFSSDCTYEDRKEILEIYNELRNFYPILDYYTAEKAVFALCLTEKWREYETLFKDIKQFYDPSIPVYCEVILTLFKNGEIDLGWKFIEEIVSNNAKVPEEVLKFWLERHKTDKDLMRVIDLFTKFNVMPSFQVSEAIKITFENISVQRRGAFSTVLNNGVCKSCGGKLEQARVSKEDYEHLKSAFLNPVLIGKDIFLKTQPEEIDRFMKFLEKTAPFDIVLDGLNIAFHLHKSKKTPQLMAFQLKSVVSHYAAQGKRVLVVGRKHMNKWPREELNTINKYAQIFLAEDISKDDPFLLYATLYSGLGTYFVSSDMMKGHKFLLANHKLRTTFQMWQAQHQCFIKYINNTGFVQIQDPVPFMQTIQQNSGNWHIPYEVKEELTNKSHVDNHHKYWLCLTDGPMKRAGVRQHNDYQRGPGAQNKKFSNEKSFRREESRFKPLK